MIKLAAKTVYVPTFLDDQKFEEISRKKLKYMEKVMPQLKSQEWINILISPRFISTFKEEGASLEGVDKTNPISIRSYAEKWEPHMLHTYNLESGVKKEHKPLRFYNDYK